MTTETQTQFVTIPADINLRGIFHEVTYEIVTGVFDTRTEADVACPEGQVVVGPYRPALPCGCYPHVRTFVSKFWGSRCEVEQQGYCNFECPHEEDE